MAAINVAAIVAAVEAAEEAALNEVADFIASDARARAPVRKVFKEAKGFKRKFRALTTPERNLAIKRAVAYKGYTDSERRLSVGYLEGRYRGVQGRMVGAEVRRRGSANSLARSRTLRVLGTASSFRDSARFTARVDAVRSGRGFQSASLHPLLTSRGRYEVSSGRGIHREVEGGNVSVRIGGALRASISNEGVMQTNNGMAAKVSASIRYAKFVEFPTTHNASQPFLLPALHGNRGRLRQTLVREIRSRLGG